LAAGARRARAPPYLVALAPPKPAPPSVARAAPGARRARRDPRARAARRLSGRGRSPFARAALPGGDRAAVAGAVQRPARRARRAPLAHVARARRLAVRGRASLP
jgi:hypothetical protein